MNNVNNLPPPRANVKCYFSARALSLSFVVFSIASMMNNPAMMQMARDAIGAGGGDGNPLASMMNNPAMMNMAQQAMQNPEMMAFAQNMMNDPSMMANMFGGAGGGGGSSGN